MITLHPPKPRIANHRGSNKINYLLMKPTQPNPTKLEVRRAAMLGIVGLWKDRTDLPDTETYIRNLRKGRRIETQNILKPKEKWIRFTGCDYNCRDCAIMYRRRNRGRRLLVCELRSFERNEAKDDFFFSHSIHSPS